MLNHSPGLDNVETQPWGMAACASPAPSSAVSSPKSLQEASVVLIGSPSYGPTPDKLRVAASKAESPDRFPPTQMTPPFAKTPAQACGEMEHEDASMREPDKHAEAAMQELDREKAAEGTNSQPPRGVTGDPGL